MSSSINRRDFLKLGGLLPLGLAGPRLVRMLGGPASAQAGQHNVIIVVFDSFSAYDTPLYGYSRETTPNLARLAQRAIVYHNHFAAGNCTTPGTASLLTGTLPWTHRAIQQNREVAAPFVTRNIFHVFQDFYRVAYTHNNFASTLLRQFQGEIDELVPRERFFLGSFGSIIESLFRNDDDIASVGWTRGMSIGDGYAYSLLLSHLYQAFQDGEVANLRPLFPRGLPTTGVDNNFVLEQVIDWLKKRLTAIPQPFFGYFHFLPPHSAYRTSLEFYGRFAHDGLKPIAKPIDVFADNALGRDALEARTEYDEYILYADQAFGDLYDSLERSGLLENTWIVLTSDHGEMFERGLIGHGNPTLYQPVIRVPLLIYEPGRGARMDIHTPTSAVDVLPTLAHVTGHAIPDWAEGVLLPPYAAVSPDPNRRIYALQARKNEQYAPLTEATAMLLRERYKLLYAFGYVHVGVDELVRLYNIEADPEELVDLNASQPEIAAELLGELKSKLAEVNRPYLPPT